MNKWCSGVLFLYCVLFVRKLYAQTSTQACSCVKFDTCYQNLTGTGPGPGPAPNSTDGSGVIDIRIVNGGGGGTATVPPVVTPPVTITCPAGQEVCCTPNTGCGVRYNIPPTATTTPAVNQARYGSQPWQAVILAMDNTYVGGGVLLDSQNVLTAAHKLINRTEGSIKVRLGEWNANQDVEPYKVVDAMVSRITRHESFTGNNLFNDVAVVRLATPVSISTAQPAINTICPPTASSFDNMRCIVTGWGKDAFSGSMQSIVKEVDVPIVPSATCQQQLQTNTRLGSSFILNTNSFVCAGGEANKDACVGDGGSPLVCNVGGKYQIVGLVAWGMGCGTASVPGVYVKVQSFWPWITSKLN